MKRLRIVPAACLLSAASLLAPTSAYAWAGPAAHAASASSMTVSGFVYCYDQQPVTGVWIQASGGSGFASMSVRGYPYNVYFSRGGVSGSWTVHVGCGGTTQSWKYSPNGNVTVTKASQSWTCYTPDTSKGNYCATYNG